VLAHPLVIAESFGAKVLVRALLVGAGCVDTRSRARFERFFTLTERHLACCREQLRALRARGG